MENIHEKLKYIEDNIEYIDIMDECDFRFYRLYVKDRPVFPFLNPDNSLTAKNYFRMLIEDIVMARTKQHIEAKKMLMERQKERAALSEEDKRKEFEELNNIKRDSKGRLNKGAKLAKKDSCNETKIYLIWKKYQVFTPIAERLLEKLKSELLE